MSARSSIDANQVQARANLSWRREAGVFVCFLAVSCLYFARPLLHHPGRSILGTGPDNEIFVWAFAWWPHAIASWTNPFVTHALYAPSGANLVWTTSVPALSLVFTPLTLLFGPVVSFNVAALVLPAVAAWAAFRLCFALTASVWASLVGGYLYGFSSFVLAQQITAHVFLTASFVLPLVALALVRQMRGEWGRRRFALCFGGLIALQLGISTEVTLTLTLILVLSLGLALLFVRDVRGKARSLLRAVAEGYCVAALLAAPLVVYAVAGFRRHGFVQDPGGTDLLNVVFPTRVNAIAGDAFPSIAAHFDPHDDAIFVGLPVLLIVALYCWTTRRSGWTRFLLAAFAGSVILALGPRLHVDGHDVMPLPWTLLEHAPGFDNVSTPRFGAYAALVSAVVAGLWIARGRGRIFERPYVLPILAVAALVPAFWHPVASLTPPRPAFFTGALYKTCLDRGETLAIFPYGGEADVLQAETGFRFRVAGGYLTPLVFGARPVISFNSDPTVLQLDYWGDRGLPTADGLRAFAARNRVDRFVTFDREPYPTARLLRAFGPVQHLGGVYVAPACGTTSLRSRPLTPGAQQVLREQRAGTTIRYCRDGYGYDLPAGLRPAALIEGATRAVYVTGRGLSCTPPAGFVRRGYAPVRLHLPFRTYAYYVPAT